MTRRSRDRGRPPVPVTTSPIRQILPTQAAALRQLYWENVVREMLTDLSVAAMSGKSPEIFDGRFAILTYEGERIPIASVTPVFACGIPGDESEKALSIAVECTVFRIRAPDGEVFTLPLSQIRGVHTLTAELLEQLEKQAMDKLAEGDNAESKPFGLAAFTHAATQDAAAETPASAENIGTEGESNRGA